MVAYSIKLHFINSVHFKQSSTYEAWMDTLNLCFSCINKWDDLRSASLDPLGHPSCRTCVRVCVRGRYVRYGT